MNLIDALLLLIIIIGIWYGYEKGFLLGALDLVFLLLSLLAAFKAYPHVGAFFERHSTSVGAWTLPLAFLICYLAARLLLSIISGSLLREVRPETHRDAFNKMLGVIPGTINGALNAAIVAALLISTPIFDSLSEKTRQSRLAAYFIPPIEWAEAKLAPVFDKAINHSINSLTIAEESKQSVKLSFTVTEPRVREDLEVQMLVLVNEARAKEGLPPLAADTAMRRVARAHSADMFARSYFAHVNPEGKTPADRARAAGVRFLTAGENLALAPTLTMAHNGLMKSPGHRANILHKAFGRVGIGILEGGRYGLMVTQNFRN